MLLEGIGQSGGFFFAFLFERVICGVKMLCFGIWRLFAPSELTVKLNCCRAQ